MPRNRRMTVPYIVLAPAETLLPGGSSMNGMNLSGNPGLVHAMQMPPTLGHPPTPLIQPRLGTLHFTTGPQQPSLTRQVGESYADANCPCSKYPARSQPSWTVAPNSHFGRSWSSRGIIGACPATW